MVSTILATVSKRRINEPQIISALGYLPELQENQLTRIITWQGISSDSRVTDLQRNYENYPFKHPLTQTPQGPLFRIHEVVWFIKLWENKNHWAPPYAPKRLKNGLKFVLSGSELTSSFQHVSKSLWYETDYNPTTVIPLTYENFDLVIQQQAALAKTYLKEKE